MSEERVGPDLGEMPIPVISNNHIINLLDKGLRIEPFNHEMLGPTSYRLRAFKLRFARHDEEGLLVPDEVISLASGKRYRLLPGAYAVISPREKITLPEGFIADFFPSSWCIENQLLTTCGRLDATYDADLVFGIYNAGRLEVELDEFTQVFRCSVGWMGRSNKPTYTGTPPGAYIHQLSELRAREEVIKNAKLELERQEEEIERARLEIQKKSGQSG